MAKESVQGTDGGEIDARGLHEHISHWVEALDRWVKDLDRGMGRQGGNGGSQQPVDDIGADP